MNSYMKVGLFCVLMAWAGQGWCYPLDGYPYTGILRLEGFRLAQKSKVVGIKIPAGARLDSDRVDLRLGGRPDFEIPGIDSDFSKAVEKFLGDDADRYGVAVLNLSDPDQPMYAEHNGGQRANVGSVGKVLVALGLFQALADIYPDDIDRRLDVLRSTLVTADQFIQTDSHKVPFWNLGDKKIRYRPLRIGDRANLWTYLDWMLSASSNAATSMVIRELMLMVQFRDQYPPGDEQARNFFSETSKKELKALLFRALLEPITRNGLDIERLRQGSLYKCKAEPNFKCGKYEGNVVNRLASLAIVESPAAERKLYYMVVVMSNVLRKNSALAHQTLATRIHRLIESRNDK